MLTTAVYSVTFGCICTCASYEETDEVEVVEEAKLVLSEPLFIFEDPSDIFIVESLLEESSILDPTPLPREEFTEEFTVEPDELPATDDAGVTFLFFFDLAGRHARTCPILIPKRAMISQPHDRAQPANKSHGC